MNIDPKKLTLDELKNLVANHETKGATEAPLYRQALDELESRVGPAGRAVTTKGPRERSRSSRMANWTMRHGKDDAANPYSKQNMLPRPK